MGSKTEDPGSTVMVAKLGGSQDRGTDAKSGVEEAYLCLHNGILDWQMGIKTGLGAQDMVRQRLFQRRIRKAVLARTYSTFIKGAHILPWALGSIPFWDELEHA